MEKVDLFDVKVRHGGVLTHEIPKNEVTMREIILLRAIHGDDAVPDSLIKKLPKQREIMDLKLELFDLARRYANTSDPMSGKKLVERVFTTALTGFETWFEEQNELREMEREERMEQSRKATAAAQAAAAVEALRVATGTKAAVPA